MWALFGMPRLPELLKHSDSSACWKLLIIKDLYKIKSLIGSKFKYFTKLKSLYALALALRVKSALKMSTKENLLFFITSRIYVLLLIANHTNSLLIFAPPLTITKVHPFSWFMGHMLVIVSRMFAFHRWCFAVTFALASPAREAQKQSQSDRTLKVITRITVVCGDCVTI